MKIWDFFHFVSAKVPIIVCAAAALFLCWHHGFPLKHRNPPSFESLITVVLGSFSGLAGLQLLFSNTISPTQVALAGIILVFAGMKGIKRGFDQAPPPPPSEPDKTSLPE